MGGFLNPLIQPLLYPNTISPPEIPAGTISTSAQVKANETYFKSSKHLREASKEDSVQKVSDEEITQSRKNKFYVAPAGSRVRPVGDEVGWSGGLAKISRLVEQAQKGHICACFIAEMADVVLRVVGFGVLSMTIVMLPFMWVAGSLLPECVMNPPCVEGRLASWPLGLLAWLSGLLLGMTNLLNGMQVLIVLVQFALVFAKPPVELVGRHVAKRLGIAVESGAGSLELAHEVSWVVFDKSGTLTEGRPMVMATKLFCGMRLDDLVKLAAAVEVKSENPLARAIVAYAWHHHHHPTSLMRTKPGRENGGRAWEGATDDRSWLPVVENFQAVAGSGVQAMVGGRSVAVGNRGWMKQNGVDLSLEVEKHVQGVEDGAKTAILVGVDGQLVGALAIADPLKPEATAVIHGLWSMGIRSMVVTGDSWRTAHAFGAEVGVAEVMAEVLSEGKAAVVRDLQAAGAVVAMVGDGVNDCSTLTAADIGVVIGTAAGKVWKCNNLEDVITAIDLSRKMIDRIRLNHLLAFWWVVLQISTPVCRYLRMDVPSWVAPSSFSWFVMYMITSFCLSLLLLRYRRPKLTDLKEMTIASR